jgi:hypothetical protein
VLRAGCARSRDHPQRWGGGAWVCLHCFGVDELFVVDLHRVIVQPRPGEPITALGRRQEAVPG